MVALPQRLDIRDDESRPGATIIYLNDHRIAAFGATSNAELALAYHERGVRVFPCREDRFGPSEEHPKGDPEAKKPYPGVMWQGPEPSRRASIERWWRDWPDALIGVGLGERNLLVIDVDGGAAGVAAWEAYCAARGISLDGVPYVDTPTGGRHYFFRLPAGVTHGNGRGGLPKKAELPVDVRGGKSGYVIAAGTDRAFRGLYRPDSGDTFAWLDAGLIPNQLLEVLQGKREHDDEPAAPAPSLPAIVTTPADHGHHRVRGWIEAAFRDEIEGVASCPSGGRNEGLNRAAFALGQFVAAGFLPEDQVRGALESAAAACGLWKDDGAAQCRKTINSGLRSGMREPRPIPPDILEDIEADRMGAEIRRTLVVQPDGSMLDPETGEITDPEPDEFMDPLPSSVLPTGGQLPTVCAADFEGRPIPRREWLAEGIVPARTVTLFTGDGGVGKSLAALQFAVAVALGTPWLGIEVKHGPALFLTAEDELDEIHRRLADVARALNCPLGYFDKLHIAALAGEDALLATQERSNSKIVKATALFDRLKARVDALKPALVVLDTLADLFGGEENDRAQARQFIGLLRGLAMKCGTTVVLLSHPSLSGMATGTGSSGSTAWSNSVRSRLYMYRPPKIDGRDADPDARILEAKKANYGKVGTRFALRWKDGVFVREAGVDEATGETLAAQADRVFVELLMAYKQQGRNISASPSSTYAPTLFAAEEKAKGLSKGDLANAMRRLFDRGIIRVVTEGPRSKERSRLVLADGPPAERDE